MLEFMPMVAARPGAGTLRATGKMTGTEYDITEQGTWVWLEDLPALLAEQRPVCTRIDVPVQAFFLVAASIGDAVPYRPWPGQGKISGEEAPRGDGIKLSPAMAAEDIQLVKGKEGPQEGNGAEVAPGEGVSPEGGIAAVETPVRRKHYKGDPSPR